MDRPYHEAKRRRLEEPRAVSFNCQPSFLYPGQQIDNASLTGQWAYNGSNFEPPAHSINNTMDGSSQHQNFTSDVQIAGLWRTNHVGSQFESTLGQGAHLPLPQQVVCFGSITTIRVPKLEPVTSQTKLRFGSDGEVFRELDDASCGRLESDDTELLCLFRNEEIDFDLLWVPGSSPVQNSVGTLWLTLYGDRELAKDLGHTLQSLNIYLQDPIFSERDVLYWNPHKFCNDQGVRTVHLKVGEQPNQLDRQQIVVADILAHFVSEDTLPETEGSPFLRTPLKRHQKRGLTFMIRREQGWCLGPDANDVWSANVDQFGTALFVNNIDNSTHSGAPTIFRGGIMADNMGLATQNESMLGIGAASNAATLIVVPSSILPNWETEISKHLTPGHLSLYCHHGAQRWTNSEAIKSADIVLVTYPTLAQEWRNKGHQGVIFTHHWHRVILDEAHSIKDASTVMAQAAYALSADRRWAVTGTPIQNRLSELHSLFRFLQLYPYSNKQTFDEHITLLWRTGQEEEALGRLKRLLKFVMLRRPSCVVTLPRRMDNTVLLELDRQERSRYDQAKEIAINFLDDMVDSESSNDGYSNALSKITALRMVCNLGYSSGQDVQSLPDLPHPESTADKACWSLDNTGETLSSLHSLGLNQTCINCLNPTPGSKTSTHSRPRGVPCLVANPPPLCSLCLRNWSETNLDGFILEAPSDTALPEGVAIRCKQSHGRQYPTKIRALVGDLQRLTSDTKSVVFSYWKTTLDAVNAALSEAGINCLQIDGKTPSKLRAEILRAFSDDQRHLVLLLSLSCGAVGLTLTAASRAYLMEPQWNPAIEEQALARIHRLGQTKEVTTIRFVIDNSIEKYVLDVKDSKRDLISLLFTGNGSRCSQVTRAKLQALRHLLR